MTNKQLIAMYRRAESEWSRAYRQTKNEDMDALRSPLMASIEKTMSVLDRELRARKLIKD